MKIYWSRQHGAYITLITAWIIAVVLTGFSLFQVIALIFLLASLNGTELFAEKLTRKSRMPAHKSRWLIIYGVISIAGALCLVLFNSSFRILLLPLGAGAIIFIVLAKFKKQKSLSAELLTFILFVIASFAGSNFHWDERIIIAMIIMILFFGSSVFTVKQRFERLNSFSVVIYLVISIIAILFLTHASAFGIAVSLLMVIKTSGVWGWKKKFMQLRISRIGMMEAVIQLVLIVVFLLLY